MVYEELNREIANLLIYIYYVCWVVPLLLGNRCSFVHDGINIIRLPETAAATPRILWPKASVHDGTNSLADTGQQVLHAGRMPDAPASGQYAPFIECISDCRERGFP